MDTAYLKNGYGLALMLSSCLMLAVAWIFSLGRIYVRCYLLQLWRIEDWLFVSSLFSFTLLIASNIIGTLHGGGQYLQDIRPTDVGIAVKFLAYGKIFYTQTILFTRLSVGFFLLQLAPRSRGYRLIILYTLFLISAIGILLFFINIFQSIPNITSRSPYPSIPSYKWSSIDLVEALCIVHAATGTIADILFAVLPITLIYNLSIPLKTKITTSVLLSLGLIAGLTNIVRITYIVTMPEGTEMLHDVAKVTIWSMVEPATAITCLGISSWKPLLCGFRNDLNSTTSEEKTSNEV